MADKNGTLTANGVSGELEIRTTGTAYIGSTTGQDFDGGTVTVQLRGPDGEWYPLATTYTASDVVLIEPGAPTRVRLSLASSTSPDLDWGLVAK